MWCMLMHLFGHERYVEDRSSASTYPESAEEILRRRYAIGELTKEQYQDMKATLDSGAGHSVTLSRHERK
ncbi:MAG: SHOCT domain-containing protein [Caldiserica bacterium]|nr:SHOCT domain-containing protein [Caldisericota bacterium]